MHGSVVVVEAASSPIFAVVDSILRTHALGHRILPSATRKVVLDWTAAQARRA